MGPTGLSEGPAGLSEGHWEFVGHYIHIWDEVAKGNILAMYSVR